MNMIIQEVSDKPSGRDLLSPHKLLNLMQKGLNKGLYQVCTDYVYHIPDTYIEMYIPFIIDMP